MRGGKILVEEIAAVIHDANRRLQLILGDANPSQPWDNASDSQKVSACEGVEKALAGATPRELHDSWCALKIADGWHWGDTKDEAAKTHPCLVDYSELPQEQRAKDFLFSTIAHTLADQFEVQ